MASGSLRKTSLGRKTDKGLTSFPKGVYKFQCEEKVPIILGFLNYLRKKGGKENLSPYFRQKELSLLFLIFACPKTVTQIMYPFYC